MISKSGNGLQMDSFSYKHQGWSLFSMDINPYEKRQLLLRLGIIGGSFALFSTERRLHHQ